MALRLSFASLLLALLLGGTAFAQAQYNPAQFPDHGFGLSLPAGELVRPGSSDWDNDQEVAFEWYGGPESPVVLIQARVDDLGSDIDADTFRMFADALLANWAPAPAAQAPSVGPFEVLNAADNLQIGGRIWNLIEVADSSAPDTPVYYSVFSTYEGRRIYTVTLYYLEPNMEQVQQFGRPVLQDFSVL